MTFLIRYSSNFIGTRLRIIWLSYTLPCKYRSTTSTLTIVKNTKAPRIRRQATLGRVLTTSVPVSSYTLYYIGSRFRISTSPDVRTTFTLLWKIRLSTVTTMVNYRQ